ncbi:D-glycero-beta-D-manno-heptose 1-phosphate adenylyltransferase [Mariprofundus erugo]|uniref:D-glycero-beta-D-manno-heptose 1-phosphate adenylyltransferase n=1 Tax=Mariprofundus erugo TaxID=2528639 RepID=A0A5R9GYZ3_9PROT|nr:D-glycero-beta-D-manno-heptose 1-phosphate adenylyltransferase [Mariprofundus erugo]TLS68992.1 D-glycero-beta-D-manno-heptose 1-phosphate adenylyltransferase [Mariprofundus erugo]
MNSACDPAGARLIVDRWQADGRRIVFTNGCFDLLHPGHIDYLSRARALGDVLIVGLNDDDSIRRLKGESRPVNPLADRAIMLAALRSVDLVVPFSEDTPLKLISALKPDILVKGGDYEPANIVGAEVVLAAGGKVVVMPFIEGYSTTRLIRRIYSLPR